MELRIEELNLALDYLCQEFGGEWLLLGGSLVRVELDSSRGTHDIDICRMSDDSLSERTRLIEAMKRRGISPEQLNSAVDFFLKQIPDWENHIKPLRSGKVGKIFRPTLTLFSILKLRRGSPVDLNDVRLALKKWGLIEFSEKDFLIWATPREIDLAKNIGLLHNS